MPSSPVQQQLAATAARLVVDEGMDYGSAKRKALRQAGTGRSADLPSDEQVEDEVREHLALFHADTQPAELAELRRVALGWMQRLAEFRPHLGGAVWRGTATRLSPVLIDLYCDDAKSAEIALINQRLDYEVGSHTDGRGRSHDVLRLAQRHPGLGGWVDVHLAVRDLDDLRGALKPDARGRSWRGDTAALQRLIAQADAPADGVQADTAQADTAPAGRAAGHASNERRG